MPLSSGSTDLRLSENMLWQSIKDSLSIVWDWCKRHWQILVGFLGAVFLFVFFRKKSSDTEVVDHTVTSHREEVNVIDRSHSMETDLIDRARVRHDAAVSEIINNNERQTAAINEKAEERAHQILSDHGNDPDEITRRIGAVTGIKVK
jgi:hypothetical protein